MTRYLKLKLLFLFLILILLIIKIQFKCKNEAKTTVISIYFKINKSKHNDLKYQKWIQNFLISVKSPLVLFTDNNSISEQSLELRKNLATKLYIYSSHWDILKEIEHKRKKNYTLNYKYIQHKLDPEKTIHSPDLYVLWNIKTYIMNKIAQENPFNSKMFVYTDSGAWRNEPLLDWPNELFIKNISNLIQDRILLSQISDLQKNIYFPFVDIIQAGFFMGSKIAISNFEASFWEIHDQHFDNGLFIGKEQTTINIFAFKKNKSNPIAILKSSNTNCMKKVDVWFFYQYYLASNKYYICNNRTQHLLIEQQKQQQHFIYSFSLIFFLITLLLLIFIFLLLLLHKFSSVRNPIWFCSG